MVGIWVFWGRNPGVFGENSGTLEMQEMSRLKNVGVLLIKSIIKV